MILSEVKMSSRRGLNYVGSWFRSAIGINHGGGEGVIAVITNC